MPTPSKYPWQWWCKEGWSDGMWFVVPVIPFGDEHVIPAGCVGNMRQLNETGSHWGERIPDNDTLKAMRELAAADPCDLTEMENREIRKCRHCGLVSVWMRSATIPRTRPEHAPGCHWQRAQQEESDDDD